jgi:hypothetical protein
MLDQSQSMSQVFSDSNQRKADFVADVVNRTLNSLTMRCTKSEEEVRDYYSVSVIGYSTKAGPAFSGPLSDSRVARISEIAEKPARIDPRMKKVSDGAGGIVETKVRFPIWVEPTAEGRTSMCEAFRLTRDLVSDWISKHPGGFPPTVLHLTDGESTDGDPTTTAGEILSTGTEDGGTLVFNCHVSSRHSVKLEYPPDESSLPDEFAKLLFNISSPLPQSFRRAAADLGIATTEGSRGFVFNGDPVSVSEFFEIGTRPAPVR